MLTNKTWALHAGHGREPDVDVGTAWSHTRPSVAQPGIQTCSCAAQLGDGGGQQLLESAPVTFRQMPVTLEKTFALRDTRLVKVNLNWFGKQVSEQCADIHPYYYTQIEFNSFSMTQKWLDSDVLHNKITDCCIIHWLCYHGAQLALSILSRVVMCSRYHDGKTQSRTHIVRVGVFCTAVCWTV